MIFVTQGSDPSIGLEVFFKSFLSIPREQTSHFKLFASKDITEKTLSCIKVPFKIDESELQVSNRKISVEWVSSNSPTLNSLKAALSIIKKVDTLITLPSDKKSFSQAGYNYTGYTQFFRHHFKNDHLCMVFKGKENTVGLITDHIPVHEVPNISKEDIINKTKTVLTSSDFKGTQSILFSGLNPHCGEEGLMGNEDQQITEAIKFLMQSYPERTFIGPVPADTIWKHPEFYKKESFTFFMYHDQGLGVFKTKNQLVGANITYGLDFVRMSVDHGTAPDIAYSNTADYRGCLFVVKEALKRELGL